MKTYPEGIKVHGIYNGKIKLTTTSLGGLVTIYYKDHIYNGIIESIDAVKFSKMLGNDKYIQQGKIDGTFIYHKRPRTGHTDFVATDVVLHNLNLDKQISTVNDALNFNIPSIMDRTLGDDVNSTNVTKIDHVQFDIELQDDHYNTKDIALRTEYYRVSVFASVHKRGQIKHFDVSLLDKNGCAVVTQELEGDVRHPSVKFTSSAVVHVAKSVPSSMFSMGMQMMNYGTSNGIRKRVLNDKDFESTTEMILEADHFLQKTSDIVLPNDCVIIYDGKVKHPENTEKDAKKDSRFYRPSF